MATIDDLPITSISDMTDEQLHEALRVTRSARRVSSRPSVRRAKVEKAVSKKKAVAGVKQDAASLLAMIKLLEDSIK